VIYSVLGYQIKSVFLMTYSYTRRDYVAVVQQEEIERTRVLVAKVSKVQMSTMPDGDDSRDIQEISSLLEENKKSSNSLRLDGIATKYTCLSKWKCPLVIASAFLMVLPVVWFGGYPYYMKKFSSSNTAANGDGCSWTKQECHSDECEPKSVPCVKGDYVMCYEGACAIECDQYDKYGVCTQVSPAAVDKCRNESYVNFPYVASIPSEIGLLTNLKSARAVDMDMCNFPSELWALTTLEILEWGYNDIVFDFPTEVGQLTNLKRLDITQDHVKGRLWTEIGQLTNLEHFRAAWTHLSGTIPTEIGLLTKLTQLSLGAGTGNEQLTGTIPTEIGLLTNLKNLELQQALLSGPLPTEIGQLSGLTSLDLFQNPGLEGSIPSQLGNLRNLTRGINLYLTGLSGSIPVELCSLTFDDVPESGLLISCDNFDCECCVNAAVNRNYDYPPCSK
jgi:Leucine-rich repeat (LRR) protein